MVPFLGHPVYRSCQAVIRVHLFTPCKLDTQDTKSVVMAKGTRIVFIKSVILPVKLNKCCCGSVFTFFIVWRTKVRRRFEDLLTKVQNFKGWKSAFVTSH